MSQTVVGRRMRKLINNVTNRFAMLTMRISRAAPTWCLGKISELDYSREQQRLI